MPENTLGGDGGRDGECCKRVDLIPAPKKMATKMHDGRKTFSFFFYSQYVWKSWYWIYTTYFYSIWYYLVFISARCLVLKIKAK